MLIEEAQMYTLKERFRDFKICWFPKKDGATFIYRVNYNIHSFWYHFIKIHKKPSWLKKR